jgi:DNA topoisomerase-1
MAKKVKEQNLVIVESPAKAKTIEKFLGENYLVKSSYGHIRDLKKNDFGVDVDNNFEPEYIISSDKQDVVRELKKLAGQAEVVWLASDEDREGEAIAWHLFEVLELDKSNTHRIAFHEITKDAILNAIKNPRDINMDLVNAQQARRVLDRLVGFELSPVLWRKVKPSLSAGRVQSVAVRILVDREREIFGFEAKSSFRVTGVFILEDENGRKYELRAELGNRFDSAEETNEFLEKCKNARFTVSSVDKKPLTKSPAPPFTTSTLQQEASRKLGFSVSQTMSVAQKLYEAGKITYMRTDSVNLSDAALKMASDQILTENGKEYLHIRKYKTKSKGAQEAHEAIRPTYMDSSTIAGTPAEKRLYELIWKRTIASQMADARIEKTTITIDAGTTGEHFVSTGEVILFDGFLKVYIESTDSDKDGGDEEDNNIIPPVSSGRDLLMKHIDARQRWTQKPARYSEAALVRKLEELGIGRPSTYAPTISTIQQRGYIVKEDREGTERKYTYLSLSGNKITRGEKVEITGAERSKLFPTDIGMVVNDFLVKYFEEVMSFDFTAKVEKEFDDIAEGQVEWQKAIARFYKPFHKRVVDTIENSEKNTGERHLGDDPKSGKPVIVKIGRFGPMAQIGSSGEEDEKPQFASLKKGQHIETITLEEALKLFELPRTLGDFESKTVVVSVGRFGPYIRHDGKFTSLKKGVDDPYEIDLETAIERILEKRESDSKKTIKAFDEDAAMMILNGRWGAYLAYQGNNYKLPKNVEPANLTYKECLEIAASQADKVKPARKGAKSTTKRSTATSAGTGTATKSSKVKDPVKTKTTAKTVSKTKTSTTKSTKKQ